MSRSRRSRLDHLSALVGIKTYSSDYGMFMRLISGRRLRRQARDTGPIYRFCPPGHRARLRKHVQYRINSESSEFGASVATAGLQHPNKWLATLPFRLAAFVVLIAFLSQSYVIQAHFHGVPVNAGQSIERLVTQQPPPNSPFDDSSFDCPICQAYAHAGMYFTATALLLLGPISWIERVTPFLALPAISATATRNWRSRAPPKH